MTRKPSFEANGIISSDEGSDTEEISAKTNPSDTSKDADTSSNISTEENSAKNDSSLLEADNSCISDDLSTSGVPVPVTESTREICDGDLVNLNHSLQSKTCYMAETDEDSVSIINNSVEESEPTNKMFFNPYCTTGTIQKQQKVVNSSETEEEQNQSNEEVIILDSFEAPKKEENKVLKTISNSSIRTSENNQSVGEVKRSSSSSFKESGQLSFQNSSTSSYNRSHNSLTRTPMSERSILECKISAKMSENKVLLRAYRVCDPRRLEDGGKMLKVRIERAQKEIEELQEELRALPADENEEEQKSSVSVNMSVENVREMVFNTQDQNTADYGKKAMETHRVQKALTVDALVSLHSSLRSCPTADTLEQDPHGLRIDLMNHQKSALAWMLWREEQIPRGGILADDMGLGKTLSVIALILRSMELQPNTAVEEKNKWKTREERMYPGSNLIVCPATLIGQWEGQVTQHCKRGKLEVLVHHGTNRDTRAKRLARYDMVITTYGIVSQEYKNICDGSKGPLFRVNWKRIILDEAHNIRNHKSLMSRAACELESNYRWCLTGTPIHNKELDVYALLKFLRCSPFDDLMVWKRWVDNKSVAGVERLNTVVKSVLLRRTKDELKSCGALEGLPGKETRAIYMSLDKDELLVYRKVLHFSKTLLTQYLVQREEKAADEYGMNEERNARVKNRLQGVPDVKTHDILVLLLRLRQICCLPALIHAMLDKEACEQDGIENEDPVIEDLFTQISRMSIGVPRVTHEEPSADDKIKNILVSTNPVFDAKRPSSKINILLETLQEILETDDKVVIVSQWANVLNHIAYHIKKMHVKFVKLDGTVPVKNRPGIIEDFNKPEGGPRVMLLSLTAGGVGLNLTGGNRLIIFDPHWNPQLEAQACDRVYRMGQKKPVVIYKMICKETIEERIESLQKKKMILAVDVLKGQMSTQAAKLTLQDLKALFEIN